MTRHTSAPPIALTIAGSDSGGGAGIQADLKTFSALGVYGASVITALTAQNTQGVSAIHAPPAAFIRQQMCAVFADLPVAAVKTGMLGGAEAVIAVAEELRRFKPTHLVVDPVMIAKSGDPLLAADAVDALCTQLLPQASLITPNLPEAAVLTGQPEPQSLNAMHALLPALHQLGASAVLLKGGHLSNSEMCTDLLSVDGQVYTFSSERINTRNTHGTGCTLASAITAFLARGLPLAEAVRLAHDYLHTAILCADRLHVGSGQGPVHHFHALW